MIHLVPMQENEFQTYLDKVIPNYAAENIRAGYWSEEDGLNKARETFKRLLPDGVNTKDQHIYTVQDPETDQAVGVIWLNARTDTPHPIGFIYDIRIDEAMRGKGFGKQVMLAIEDKARELGLESIALHVFFHNTTALGLYEKIGYKTRSLNMVKELV